MKRIGALLFLVVAAVGVSAQAASAAPSGAVTINVTAVEYHFKLSKTSVPRGSVVTFKVTNKGKTVHDFKISALRKGTPYIQPGKTSTFKVTISKSGSYRFVCTVPRHIELGMVGNLKVK